MKKQFIEFFGSAHLNGYNVAAYELQNGKTRLIAEDIITSKEFGHRDFESFDDAENWFSNLPGINNVSRLHSALTELMR